MNTTKYIVVVAVASIFLGAFSACQNAENKNTAINQPANQPANPPVNKVAEVSASPVAAEPAATASAEGPGSPAQAYKAAYIARKTKDVPALKKLLSKDILEFFTMAGGMEEKKQTLDETLMELCKKPQAATAEVRNEKIVGDKATIEYLDESGNWSPMDFIKEGGTWKLTIDEPEIGVPDVKNGINEKK